MEWSIKNFLYRPKVKKHLALIGLGYLLGILMYGFVNFNMLHSTIELYLSGCLGVLTLYLVIGSNAPLNKILLFKKALGPRLFLGILWAFFIGFLVALTGAYSYTKWADLSWNPFTDYNFTMKLGIVLFCAALLYNLIYFALYSYNEYARGQILELQLQRKQAELQLRILKSQLSPHFLFNCLNLLSMLFNKDVRTAETFIRSMAKSYDYILEHCKTPLVSVKKELEFVNAYLFLIKTRFGKAVVTKVDVGAEAQKRQVPPLTLQLLLENAIKHNSFDANHPISIKIYDHGNALVVTNTKNLKKNPSVSTKIGLDNIDHRYKFLTHKKVKVVNEAMFTVTIPLLT